MIWKTPLKPLIVITLFSWLAYAYGQPSGLPEDFPVLVENAPDSSAGFSMLQKKMVTLPAEAKPVKILFLKGEWQNSYQMHNITIPNYWSGGENEDAQTVVSYTDSLEGSVKVIASGGNRGYNMNFDPSDQDVVVEEVDLVKELKALFTLLSSEEKNKEWQKRQLESMYGDLMLYATRLHEAGYMDQANQLAAYLFEKHSKRGTVLRALSTLADYEYMATLDAFAGGGEASAFVEASKALIEQHRAYWEIAPQLQEKVTLWEEQLALGEDALAEPVKTFSDEGQKALYAKLTGNPEALITIAEFLESENWMLQPNSYLNEMMDYYVEVEEENLVLVEALSALKQSRKAFFELAEAMLSDKRLVPYANPYEDSRVEYAIDDEPPSFPQPMTVQLIGMQMVSGLAPGDEDWENENPEDTLMMVQNYKSIIGEMNTTQLAKFYFERRGEYNLPMEAIYTLLSSEDAALRKETVERMMMEEDHLDDAMKILMDFHAYQPEEAAAGLGKILEHIKGLDPENAWSFGGPEGIKANIAKLEKMLGKEPEAVEETPDFAEALDAWIEAGDPDNFAAMQAVLSSGQKISEAEIQKILAARIATRSFEISRHLLNLQNMMIQSGGFAELQSMMVDNDQDMMRYYVNREKVAEADGKTGEMAEDSGSGLTWHKEAWLPLLKASDTDDQRKKAFYIAFTMINPLQDPTEKTADFYVFSQLLQGNDSKADRMLVDWAVRHLENPEDLSWLDEVPDMEHVSDERKQEIRDILSAEDLEASRALLTSGNLEERLVALTAGQEDEIVADNQALWESFLDAKNTIRNITTTGQEEDPIYKGLQIGDTLSLELVSEILQRSKAEALAGKKGFITIRSYAFNQGVAVWHNREFMSEGYFRDSGIRVYGITEDIRITGQFSLDIDLSLNPPAGDGPKELNILDLVDAAEDQQLESLSSAIHTWLTTAVPAHQSLGQLTIIYNGKPETEEEE